MKLERSMRQNAGSSGGDALVPPPIAGFASVMSERTLLRNEPGLRAERSARRAARARVGSSHGELGFPPGFSLAAVDGGVVSRTKPTSACADSRRVGTDQSR